MRNIVLIFILTSFNFSSIKAQNCSNLQEWDNLISQEFPDVNTYNIPSGSRVSNRILFNLYSDKYFIPFAGTSYDMLGLNSGVKSWRKLKDCRSKAKYQNLKNIGWLSLTGLGPLHSKYIIDVIKVRSQEVNNLRSDYNKLISQIQFGDVSYDDLMQFKNLANTTYTLLMPSEVENLLSVISDNEVKIANQSILTKANQYAEKEESLNTLYEIKLFEQSNQKAYSQTNSETKNKVNAILGDKKNAILTVLIQKERSELQQIGMGNVALENTNSFYKNFNNSYESFQDDDLVKQLYQEIIKTKTNIVSNLSQEISASMDNATSIAQLNDLESKYLVVINDSDPQIIKLKNYHEAKKNNIVAQLEEDRLQKAYEEKLLQIKETEALLSRTTKAHEIIDLYHKSIGGIAKLKQVSNIMMTATPEPNQDLSAYEVYGLKDFTINMILKRDGNNILYSSLFSGYNKDGKLIKLNKLFYDGKGLKSIRQSFPGGYTYPDASHVEKVFENKTTIFEFEDYKSSSVEKQFEYLGIETVENTAYHKISYQTYNPYFGWRAGVVYFDETTYLLKIIKSWSPSNVQAWDYFENYEEIQGIKVPTKKYPGLTKHWINHEFKFDIERIPVHTFTYDFK